MQEDLLRKISRALTSLSVELENKINSIEKRAYSFDVVEDLQLTIFARFFDETLSYFKSQVIIPGSNKELVMQLEQLDKFDITNLLLSGPHGFFALLWSYIEDRWLSQRRFAEEILQVFTSLQATIKNILYWIKIQL